MKRETKRYVPLTEDEIEDKIEPCPEGSDDMFWRQDEIHRIKTEHREKWEKKNKKTIR